MCLFTDLDPFRQGWLVGVLEGEASFIAPTAKSPYVRIQVNMTDRDVIERLGVLFKVKCSIKDRSYYLSGHRPQYRVVLTGSRAFALMISLYPHLCLRRREQIERAVRGKVSMLRLTPPIS